LKVKELIEELKRCNPESVIKCGGSPIRDIEQLEYYWDGYAATVKNDKWIYNTTNNKVVIHLWEMSDFIEIFIKRSNDGTYTLPIFEEFLKNIENFPENRKDDYIQFWKEEYDEIYKIYKEIELERKERIKKEKDDK
jgi:hypothetical protein